MARCILPIGDTYPIEPVPVPEGGDFVETVGPPPSVQRFRSRRQGDDEPQDT